MYIYKKTETGLWTVGFYDPNGNWEPESDHEKPEDAARRVSYLNGCGFTAEEMRQSREWFERMKSWRPIPSTSADLSD